MYCFSYESPKEELIIPEWTVNRSSDKISLNLQRYRIEIETQKEIVIEIIMNESTIALFVNTDPELLDCAYQEEDYQYGIIITEEKQINQGKKHLTEEEEINIAMKSSIITFKLKKPQEKLIQIENGYVREEQYYYRVIPEKAVMIQRGLEGITEKQKTRFLRPIRIEDIRKFEQAIIETD